MVTKKDLIEIINDFEELAKEYYGTGEGAKNLEYSDDLFDAIRKIQKHLEKGKTANDNMVDIDKVTETASVDEYFDDVNKFPVTVIPIDDWVDGILDDIKRILKTTDNIDRRNMLLEYLNDRDKLIDEMKIFIKNHYHKKEITPAELQDGIYLFNLSLF